MFESGGCVFFRVQYLVCRFLHVRLCFFTKHFSARWVLTLFLVDPTCQPTSVTRVHRWCAGYDGRITVTILYYCYDGGPTKQRREKLWWLSKTPQNDGPSDGRQKPQNRTSLKYFAHEILRNYLDRYQSVLNYQTCYQAINNKIIIIRHHQ